MDEDVEVEEEPLLDCLLKQLRGIAVADGFDPDDIIDLEKSRNILEATAGDVNVAAQLYWDDFLATQARMHHRRNEPQRRGRMEEAAAAAEPERIRGDSARSIRRRLEGEFNRQADSEPEDDDEPEAAFHGGVARIIARARETARQLGANRDHQPAQRQLNDEENEDDGNVNVAGLAAAARALMAARVEQGRESASVSDDESGGVWSMVGGIAARLDDFSAGLEQSLSSKRKRRKSEEHTERNKDEDIDEDGYLSENDWLWESLATRASIPLCAPFDLLWGLPPSAATNSAGESPPGQDEGGGNAAAMEGNVIADDEGEEESSTERAGIPRQWLHAGFCLSEDGTGLALKSPNEDDIGYFTWQQQANARNSPAPPFHCSSLTAILSIVTGLLYTGATYQSGSISCSTSRKPFGELTGAEKKREFESRLADALAVLLHIAAGASKERKKKASAWKALKRSNDPADKRKWQTWEKKLDLCPTCWWETDPQGRDLDRDLQVATSYTNIEDLRSYVLGNMRSFTSRGGCALFLETVLRIHGKGAVLRMMERSKRAANLPTTAKSLVDCACEEQNKKLKISPKKLRQRSKTKELMEAVPCGRNCMSVELISLLLTGKVHSTFKGWSTGPLGLGILSEKVGEVSRALTRPKKPVWILCGPTMYSVLFFNRGYDRQETFSRADLPESSAELMHFCCWPGQRCNTTFRLSPDRSKWVAPTISKPAAVPKGPVLHSTASENLLRRRREAALVSAEELDTVDSMESDLLVTKEQLECVHANPDDVKLYPDKYRMWRYNIETGDGEKKTRPNDWIPYHRLCDRQKLLVETKLGPRIKRILWTRWPRAVIEGFNPGSPPPLV